jgi:hypothetical protein
MSKEEVQMLSPIQVVSWNSLTFWDRYELVFPDLIRQHSIAAKIKQ